jgi:hypothetical protein
MLTALQLDFEAFFDYVEELGELDKPQRDACLEAWREGRAAQADSCPAVPTASS